MMDANDGCPELEPSLHSSGNDPQGPGSQGLEPSAVSLLETFAAVARRRATGATTGTSTTSTTNANNSRNTANSLNSSGIFGRGGLATSSVSSLVRLALSSNFPGGLLNQVFAWLSNPFVVLSVLHMHYNTVLQYCRKYSGALFMLSKTRILGTVVSQSKPWAEQWNAETNKRGGTSVHGRVS